MREYNISTEDIDWLKKMERKLDKCNHLMEFLRTLLGICTLSLQVIILLKLFNYI
jgi:hypothetical protein